METSTIVWIIVGIVVVAAIVVIAVLVTSRQRREAHLEAERTKAAELRQSAYESDVARREREAEAARAAAAAKQAEADAMQARLESERLARESASHQSDAQQLRTEADERLRKADAVDPDVDTDARDGDTREADRDSSPTVTSPTVTLPIAITPPTRLRRPLGTTRRVTASDASPRSGRRGMAPPPVRHDLVECSMSTRTSSTSSATGPSTSRPGATTVIGIAATGDGGAPSAARHALICFDEAT